MVQVLSPLVATSLDVVLVTASDYTLSNADSGTVLQFSGSCRINVPTGLKDGFNVKLVQGGSGAVVISEDGTTVNSMNGYMALAGRNAIGELFRSDTPDEFFFGGERASPVPTIGLGASVATGAAGGTTAGITTQPTGSTFAIIIGEYRSGGFSGIPAISAPTDNKGNTYTSIRSVSSSTNRATLWVCENGVGGSGHTFTNHDTKANGTMSVAEVKGFNGIAPELDVHNGAGTSGTTYSSGSVNTTTNDEVALGLCVYDYSGTSDTVPSGGFTQLTDSPDGEHINSIISYMAVSTAGPVSAGFTSTTGTYGLAIIATFKG